jgi:hypothetical protein
MFVGHYGPAFALKRAFPEAPVFGLCIGVQLVDIAWAVMVMTGIEEVRIVPGFTESNGLDLVFIPYSHSAVATAMWALFGGLAAWLIAGRSTPRIGVAVGLAIASHWLADLLMHRPDLPLYGDEMKVGLGLWNYRWPAYAAELASLFGGLALYAGGTRPRDRIGSVGLIGFAVTLAGIQLFNLLVDPATTPRATAGAALAGFLTIPIAAAWLDRHRASRAG